MGNDEHGGSEPEPGDLPGIAASHLPTGKTRSPVVNKRRVAAASAAAAKLAAKAAAIARPAVKAVPVVTSRPIVVEKTEPVDERLKKSRSLSKAEDEQARLATAAGLSVSLGVARLGTSDLWVFRCPSCSQAQQCSRELAGKVYVCGFCGAELEMPESAEDGGKVKIVRDSRLMPDGAGATVVELPTQRGEEGAPVGRKKLRLAGELAPEGDEGLLEWGLEKAPEDEVGSTRSAGWRWTAVVIVVLAAIGVVFYSISSSGRASGKVPVAAGAPDVATVDGRLDWAKVNATRQVEMAEFKIRAYLEAPGVREKARHARGGLAMQPRMQAYYSREGGVERETREFGDITEVTSGEKRRVGELFVQMVRVQFAMGGAGIYAMVQGGMDYEVDWEYAVGYGEVGIAGLVEDKPVEPVLMRVYLREGRYYGDGFTEREFRYFDMTDPKRQMQVAAYVRRGSDVEARLKDAWGDAAAAAAVQGDEVPMELDFTVRLHFDRENNRRGFMLDEILARGWILP